MDDANVFLPKKKYIYWNFLAPPGMSKFSGQSPGISGGLFVQNIFFFILHILLAPCFMHYRHRICRELKYLNCKYQEVNKLHSLILFISTIYVSPFLFLNDFRVCENFYFYHFYDFNTFIKSPYLQISSMAL